MLGPVTAALLLAGCGGGDPAPKTAAPVASSASAAQASPSGEPPAQEPVSLPPGALPGIDDYDGDGAPDPTCTTQDFGEGLVLRIPCQILNANEPPEKTTLVKDSLFRLPAASVDMTAVSGSLLAARSPAGERVFIIVFNTDGLFATGSETINSTGTLDAAITVINQNYPNGTVQIRGHTDATGSADRNTILARHRAANVEAYLTGHGLQAKAATSVGFGSSRPLVEENTAEGRAFNRRVEVAVRLPR
jgi:outer membrane protein OmpA-like peptidoglycan-associated protein